VSLERVSPTFTFVKYFPGFSTACQLKYFVRFIIYIKRRHVWLMAEPASATKKGISAISRDL
jgi:hypothetical protein